jgi:hypothetical protein
MTEAKVEQEMNNYTSPYKLNMAWEDLSKDFLIRLMLIWQKAVKDFHMNWVGAVWGKTGDFTIAAECAREVWHKHAETILPLCAEAGKIDVKTVQDVHKAIMLLPDAGTKSNKHPVLEQTVDMHQASDNVNHHRGWCNSCMWLETLEALPDTEDQIRFLCEDLCMEIYEKYVHVLMPEATVRVLKTPPRKDKTEIPVCDMECVLEK